mmetsp:Transcript_1556/g.2203  ORF Transcript_1556/g.2203 Transcript_1556/m.2203 type:complete len:266 (-) Transcript_1556:95-892(-)
MATFEPTITIAHLEKELKKIAKEQSSSKSTRKIIFKALRGLPQTLAFRGFKSATLNKAGSTITTDDENTSASSPSERRVQFLDNPVSSMNPPSSKKLKEKDYKKMWYSREELAKFVQRIQDVIEKFDEAETDKSDDPSAPGNILRTVLRACKASKEEHVMNEDSEAVETCLLREEEEKYLADFYRLPKSRTLLGVEHEYSPWISRDRRQRAVNMNYLVIQFQQYAAQSNTNNSNVQELLAFECARISLPSRLLAHQYAKALCASL